MQQIPYHLVPDSLDYPTDTRPADRQTKDAAGSHRLLRSSTGRKEIRQPRSHTVTVWYWPCCATTRPQRAEQEFAILHKQTPLNATIETLAGQIKRLDKQDKEIIAFYRTALKNFPQHHALIYDYAEVLLQDQRYTEALKLLDEQVNRDGNDPKLYELQARSYAALGRTSGRAPHAVLRLHPAW